MNTIATAQSIVTLNNGVKMPALGLGVYQSEPGDETQNAVLWALEAGYRHIDTAKRYDNEIDVGQALKRGGLPRGEVFVTTKLWNDDQGYDRTLAAFDASLKRLGLDFVDLYLVHWPLPGKRLDTWKAMTRILEEGRARAIGVSNYLERHLTELFEHSDVVPAVNQIEFSPFLYQKDLLGFCRRHGVQLEAYGPLTQGKRLDHPVVASVAARRGRTAAQVLIRWALQHGLVVIPKSVRRTRIEENAGVFDFTLSAEDMAELDSLNENFHTEWDPTEVA
jgi:diketogulonate reductase-like aldo/keto reductase